ncbi:HTH cro/C1-type domain-containing protein [Nitrospira defluvii]|uniref:HTH cro/C1-type domain-containing protein n=2 Tax=Nitrospira defluvii TaxID=330214 RepID=A0ABM8S332_9BACT|nr:HTH cro/C1-type domain-containing protein [Nitrospira defluvii]
MLQTSAERLKESMGCRAETRCSKIAAMPHIGSLIRAWRLSHKCSEQAFAHRAGIDASLLESLETEQADPNASTLEALARALNIPLPWLFIHPSELDLLCKDDEEEGLSLSTLTGADPVLDRLLLAAGHERTLYVLLTALIQSGEPKLLRAAEVSLRSLVKQSKQATVPWQSRPPGHFEPPSD